MWGEDTLIELKIIAPHATQLSLERCDFLKVLNVHCPLVRNVVMRKCRKVEEGTEERVDFVMNMHSDVRRNGIGFSEG